jgi:hypothetical protein
MLAAYSLLLAAILGATTAEQRLGRAECRFTLDSSKIALSSELRLTLIIEGPAPVEVDVPQPLVNSPDWRTHADAPQSTALPNGRERWQQSFHLEPFRVGDVALALQPLRYRTGNEVRDWQLVWPSSNIAVSSSVKDVELGSARPVTDIDRLPPVERPTGNWQYLVGTTAIVLIACIVAVIWRKRRGSEHQIRLTPAERALKSLETMEENNGPAPEQLPGLADVLRCFLEERFQFAATRQTTSEFHTTLLRSKVLAAAQVEIVADMLARCDLVKFAGAQFDHAACQRLLRNARELIAETERNGQTSSTAGSEPVR